MRIPVAALTRQDGQLLLPRDNSTTTPSPDSNSKSGGLTFIIVAVAAVVLLTFTIACYFTVKGCRSKRSSSPTTSSTKYKGPGSWLPQKLRRWIPGGNRAAGYNRSLQRSHRDSDAPSSSIAARTSRTTLDQDSELPILAGHTETEAAVSGNNRSGNNGVDRNTSVRSVMTLPAYSAVAHPTEQILGREGERAGVDVVIEFPETADEEEGRREDEMESLYQIRVARRQEHAGREENRRLRREARNRGDWETLTELRRQAREQAENVTSGTRISDQLIVEHQTRDRSRRVSSVQYADLGVARHDGTRLRANSTDSDNRPLLDAAGSIAGTGASRPTSLRTLTPLHSRGPSNSSVLSISSMASDDFSEHRLGPTVTNASGRSSSGGMTDFEIINLSNSQSRSRASSMSRDFRAPSVALEGDLGENRIPLSDPPLYDHLGWEEAPPYESPVRTRKPELPSAAETSAGNGAGGSGSTGAASPRNTEQPRAGMPPRLPTLETLPAIQITAMTPVDETSQASFRTLR